MHLKYHTIYFNNFFFFKTEIQHSISEVLEFEKQKSASELRRLISEMITQ